MKLQSGIVHFYSTESYKGLLLYYPSPNCWDFSMMIEIEIFEKKITNLRCGIEAEDRAEMSGCIFKKLPNLRELSMEEKEDIKPINAGLQVLDEYIQYNSTFNETTWNFENVKLMKLHIESRLASRNIIHDMRHKSLDSIWTEFKKLSRNDGDNKNTKLLCGICDDIDVMRMKDYYGLNLNGEEIIHGFICPHYEYAKKIFAKLKANKPSNIEILDNPSKEIISPLIFALVK